MKMNIRKCSLLLSCANNVQFAQRSFNKPTHHIRGSQI